MGIEDGPNFNKILTKEEIIERIKVVGFNEDVRQEIINWRVFRESLVVDTRGTIVLNVDMLDVYMAAGMAEDGYDDAVQTLYMARMESEVDLVERILKMYPELDKFLDPDQI